ncbi:hypothetical protein BCR42DRAFT_413089 [Absidia repens]|uniref:DUF7082 domain-containing protein n=1 Tax=Absidia repens TaxID=90262 RepID=A0A1X2IKM8_9FUNG|nr:hypothetical protein BCR42DRAFT_413089 [Absidia repens]
MNLLSPYNAPQESTSPTSTQPLLGKLPSPAAQGLPKAVSMPDIHKSSIEEPHTTYNTMFQGSIPPSPSNMRISQSSMTVPQHQQQQTPQQIQPQQQSTNPSANMTSSNAPQIMPRETSASFSFPPASQTYYNTNNTGNNYGTSGSTYGNLAYPSYQDQNMAYMQQPNTAPDSSVYDSSNYFSPAQHETQQYNYGGQQSYFGHPSNVVANPPLTPPLQQKRLSQPLGIMLPPQGHQYPSVKLSKRNPSIPSSGTDIHQTDHPFAGLVSRPQLNIHNDLMEATQNWTPAEWAMRRRVLKFWRQQQQPNLQQIDCGFEILNEESYRAERMQQQQRQQQGGDDGTTSPTSSAAMSSSYKDNLVVSCIYWQERNDYFITSVDCIQLIEGLIGVEFTVEEKNRIRRNLEALRPLTAAKTRPESVDFFKLIMGFPAPKPRNIEKDVKVFLWSTLGPAIKKIIGKYTPSYSSTASVVNYTDISSYPPPPLQHHQQQQQQLPPAPPQPQPQQQQRSAATPQLSRS